MILKLKSLLSRTYVLYILIAVLLFLFFSLKQAKTQRVYELLQYHASWMQYFTGEEVSGDVKIDKPKVRAGLRYYRLIGDVFPDRVRAFEMQGLCYVLLGDDRRAIQSFTELLKQRPHFFWVEFEKGMALYRLGQWDEALKIFQGIASHSDTELVKAAILPSLRYLPPEQQNAMMVPLVQFVYKIKEYDRRMIALCLSNHPAVNHSLAGIHPWVIFLPSATQPFND